LYVLALEFGNVSGSRLGRIQLSGLLRNSRGVPADPMRVLGSYALVYLLDGGGRYVDANGVSRAVRAGDLILLFPELAHGYGPEGASSWTEFYLVFYGPVFDLWRAQRLLDPARPIRHLEPIDHWLRRFQSVLGAPRRPGLGPALLEVCRLQLVLGEALLGGAGSPVRPEDASWVSQACALLESDLDREVDMHELARSLGVSYDGFRKKFARIVGVPPLRYRSARIIDRACELMQRGVLTDKQISEQLGFRDEFYFSRRFKQITGRSPRDFRRNLPRVDRTPE
jgi:AraC-like DNA-binding protein